MLEWIMVLATVIPCCLGIFAFFGVERIQDVLGVGRSEPQPTQVQIIVEPTLPKDAPSPAPTQVATAPAKNNGFDVTGVWVGQFNDAGFSEVTDYVLMLEQTGRNVSGSSMPRAVANPNCTGTFILRGQVDPDTETVRFSEDFNQFNCTFRGSAGNEKEFELVYNTTDGLPALTGTWKELFHGALPPSGQITFYKQP